VFNDIDTKSSVLDTSVLEAAITQASLPTLNVIKGIEIRHWMPATLGPYKIARFRKIIARELESGNLPTLEEKTIFLNYIRQHYCPKGGDLPNMDTADKEISEMSRYLQNYVRLSGVGIVSSKHLKPSDVYRDDERFRYAYWSSTKTEHGWLGRTAGELPRNLGSGRSPDFEGDRMHVKKSISSSWNAEYRNPGWKDFGWGDGGDSWKSEKDSKSGWKDFGKQHDFSGAAEVQVPARDFAQGRKWGDETTTTEGRQPQRRPHSRRDADPDQFSEAPGGPY
jgi:hypothetical protein